MARKKAQKRRKTKKVKKSASFRITSFWLAFFSLVLFSIIGISLFLNSRTKPQNLDETKSMTSLPPEMKKVLSKKIAKNQPQEAKVISLRVPILMYHYVEYVQDKGDTIRISLNIPPYVFDSQLKTLRESGYTFLTASELDDIFAGKSKLPEKPILITFDDGYRDFYTDAYPILKKYNAKATAYIVYDFLNRPNYMFSNEVLEISKDGLVEIGAHTMDHVWLRGDSLEKVKYQIEESRKKLQELTGKPVLSFAYPYGAFDGQAVQVVKEAGFTDGVSTIPGIEVTEENKFFLFRIRPGWRTGQSLIEYLSQSHFKPW